MKSPGYLAILLTSLLLLACNRDDSASKVKLFEQQRAALEKAKGVENTVQKQAQELQQSADKQSGEQPDKPAQ